MLALTTRSEVRVRIYERAHSRERHLIKAVARQAAAAQCQGQAMGGMTVAIAVAELAIP